MDEPQTKNLNLHHSTPCRSEMEGSGDATALVSPKMVEGKRRKCWRNVGLASPHLVRFGRIYRAWCVFCLDTRVFEPVTDDRGQKRNETSLYRNKSWISHVVGVTECQLRQFLELQDACCLSYFVTSSTKRKQVQRPLNVKLQDVCHTLRLRQQKRNADDRCNVLCTLELQDRSLPVTFADDRFCFRRRRRRMPFWSRSLLWWDVVSRWVDRSS